MISRGRSGGGSKTPTAQAPLSALFNFHIPTMISLHHLLKRFGNWVGALFFSPALMYVQYHQEGQFIASLWEEEIDVEERPYRIVLEQVGCHGIQKGKQGIRELLCCDERECRQIAEVLQRCLGTVDFYREPFPGEEEIKLPRKQIP